MSVRDFWQFIGFVGVVALVAWGTDAASFRFHRLSERGRIWRLIVEAALIVAGLALAAALYAALSA